MFKMARYATMSKTSRPVMKIQMWPSHMGGVAPILEVTGFVEDFIRLWRKYIGKSKGKQLEVEAIQNNLMAMIHEKLNRGKTLNTVRDVI